MSLFLISFLLLIIAVLAFEVAMFIHVLKNQSISSERRLLWALGMLVIHPFVAIVYFVTDYQRSV